MSVRFKAGEITSARPVSITKNGKVKARKRKPNSLGTLSTVTGFVYPGGNNKLVKDATTDPFARKKRKKAKAKNRPKKRSANKKAGSLLGMLGISSYTRKRKAAKTVANRKTAKRRKVNPESKYVDRYLATTRGGRLITPGTFLAGELHGKAKKYSGGYLKALMSALRKRGATPVTSVNGKMAYV